MDVSMSDVYAHSFVSLSRDLHIKPRNPSFGIAEFPSLLVYSIGKTEWSRHEYYLRVFRYTKSTYPRQHKRVTPHLLGTYASGYGPWHEA